ncbi:hypothetical protein AK51_04650 [Serratia nematodiphila DZ0503SBS1]|nr:hypothetical protein AK51_04650 [Serratia nematodiphila DZ0503SBS1]
MQWAQRRRAWIIEDDYDAEFNYDRQTKAALQGLDSGGRTLYIGTFSKTLFPGLRIGFMIAPPQLVRPLVAARQFQDGYTSALAQMTLFHCLHEGATPSICAICARFTRRGWMCCTMRCNAISHPGRARLPQGGLQLVCPLADAATERRLVAAAAERGIRLYGLADFYTGARSAGRWCSVSRPTRRTRSCVLSPRWRRCSTRCRGKTAVKIGLLAVLNWSVLRRRCAVYSAAIRLFP